MQAAARIQAHRKPRKCAIALRRARCLRILQALLLASSQIMKVTPMRLFPALFALALALFSAGASAQSPATAQAVFAGGCFWCMEPPYDKLDGVISTTSGYTGGDQASANYHSVSAGNTGHYEVVRVEYDPAKVSYKKLLDVFWRNVDPLDAEGQFCDKGDQYRSAIFYGNDEEKRLAEESKAELAASKRWSQPIATEVLPAKPFYAAEDYHQDYYEKNPLKYKFYRFNCRRDARLDEVWGADREQASH
jgi:peptide-methionine (S)-S-oxide reductase